MEMDMEMEIDMDMPIPRHVDKAADRGFDLAALERLSALVDGELESHAVTHACADWHSSGTSRGSWHAYQLISDVLRSDDLASDPARDAAFLQALRRRLVDEPVYPGAAEIDGPV